MLEKKDQMLNLEKFNYSGKVDKVQLEVRAAKKEVNCKKVGLAVLFYHF